MHRRSFAITLVLVAAIGNSPRQANCRPHHPADRLWIVGTWRSYDLDYGDFWEWHRAAKVELVATSPEKIELFLILADGRRIRAYDSEPCSMDERTMFFGPIGSGLSFDYRRPSDDVLILDLKTDSTAIHVELRRQKK